MTATQIKHWLVQVFLHFQCWFLSFIDCSYMETQIGRRKCQFNRSEQNLSSIYICMCVWVGGCVRTCFHQEPTTPYTTSIVMFFYEAEVESNWRATPSNETPTPVTSNGWGASHLCTVSSHVHIVPLTPTRRYWRWSVPIITVTTERGGGVVFMRGVALPL